MLRLSEVNLGRLGALVSDACRTRAPYAVVGDLDEADDLSSADLG